MDVYLFYIFSFITVSTVILMILQKNPISSAFCLIISFFSLAALYALLSAHFVAVLQILVYAGAVMVLFVFVIMLLNLKKNDYIRDKLNLGRIIAILIGLGLFAFFAIEFLLLPLIHLPELAPEFGTAEQIGELMFTKYVIPFELIGVLLLVGIVGAVLLGRKES